MKIINYLLLGEGVMFLVVKNSVMGQAVKVCIDNEKTIKKEIAKFIKQKEKEGGRQIKLTRRREDAETRRVLFFSPRTPSISVTIF